MDEDELPKLPPLEEVLRKARESIPEERQDLSKSELLKQLSGQISGEEYKRLTSGSNKIICPLLQVIDGVGEVKIARGVFSWSPNVDCIYFFKANPIQMQKGSCIQLFYKRCHIADMYNAGKFEV